MSFTMLPAITSSNSFSNDGRRDTPRKMELAAFLSRVGISGTVREDLVEALDGVDSLYMLSDAQFELYNVSPDKKLQIDMMLEDRRRARMESRAVVAWCVSRRDPPSSGLDVASWSSQV